MHRKVDPIVILLLTIFQSNGQSIDETSKGERICVTNSFRSYLNGAYEYEFTSSNGLVYRSNSTYLVPYISSEFGSYEYYIQSYENIGTNFVSSYCYINDAPTGYTMDPDDCYKGWATDFGGEFYDDADMRVVNCNDLCVTGYTPSWVNGYYIWLLFNLETNSSIWYSAKEENNENDLYVYASPDEKKWYIGVDWTSSLSKTYASCTYSNITSDGMITLDTCGEWSTWDNADFKVTKSQCSTKSDVADDYDSDVADDYFLALAYTGFLMLFLLIFCGILYVYKQNQDREAMDAFSNNNVSDVNNINNVTNIDNNNNVIASGNNNNITIVNTN